MTLLYYEIDATVGGKMAQVGSTLHAAIRKLADTCFDSLSAYLVRAEDRKVVQIASSRAGLRPFVWVPLLIAFVLLILYLFSGR
jgi:hypothetical protein